jgi:anti-sigma regulatory factor (Ser/Thr protein kinase)
MEKRVLIARWLASEPQPLPIYDEASVSSARLCVRETGERLNLDKELVENVALMASELTHNHLVHAKQGYFAVKSIERQGVRGLEIIAADMGRGLAKPAGAIRNGPATNRSLGAGLAAVFRIADEVDIDTRIEEGTCIVARKFETAAANLCCEVAIMGRPFPGEGISGDDAVFAQTESGFFAAVSDGLGHGPEARAASYRSIEILCRQPSAGLNQILLDMDRELNGTRGCAISVARYTKQTRQLECASLGDVHSHVYRLRDAHFFAATPFVIGAGQLPRERIRIETAVIEPGSVLVIFSDGLKSRTSLKGQLDVLRQPTIGIAQHLIEHDSRPDDDATVLVARFLS